MQINRNVMCFEVRNYLGVKNKNAKVIVDTGSCLQKAKHIGIKHNHAKPKVILGSSARAASSLPLSNSRLPQRKTKSRQGNVWLYFHILSLITVDYLFWADIGLPQRILKYAKLPFKNMVNKEIIINHNTS